MVYMLQTGSDLQKVEEMCKINLTRWYFSMRLMSKVRLFETKADLRGNFVNAMLVETWSMHESTMISAPD